jgi:hypothetical protein
MRLEQCVHLLRHLIGGIVADTGENRELVGGCDEFTGPFGRLPSNCVVLVAQSEADYSPAHFEPSGRMPPIQPRFAQFALYTGGALPIYLN